MELIAFKKTVKSKKKRSWQVLHYVFGVVDVGEVGIFLRELPNPD